jgi:hypothetical protein
MTFDKLRDIFLVGAQRSPERMSRGIELFNDGYLQEALAVF